MRSWMTFLIFGVIIVAVLIFSSMSQKSIASHPVVRTANDFLKAVQKNDVATVQQLCDSSAVKVARSGDTIVSLAFAEARLIDGPYARKPARIMAYPELENLQVDLQAKPNVLDTNGVATVKTTTGELIYLRKITGAWKIYYIAQRKEP